MTVTNLTVFRELFGSSPLARAIDFFFDNSVFDYSMADVVREEEISYNTLRPIWHEMIARDIIIKTRTVGKAEMYKLNRKNVLVQKLWDLNVALVEQKTRVIKRKVNR